MWKDLPWSPMRRCTVGYGKTNFRERMPSPLALKTIEVLQPIKDLIHTITADNGKEFAKHQEIAEELEISFYFW